MAAPREKGHKQLSALVGIVTRPQAGLEVGFLQDAPLPLAFDWNSTRWQSFTSLSTGFGWVLVLYFYSKSKAASSLLPVWLVGASWGCILGQLCPWQ